MMFEYDEDKESGDPVAYIDADGDLRIYDGIGYSVVLLDNNVNACSRESWDHTDPTIKRRFYRGDKLTITF